MTLAIMGLGEVAEALLFWRALSIQLDLHPSATPQTGSWPEVVKWARCPGGTHR